MGIENKNIKYKKNTDTKKGNHQRIWESKYKIQNQGKILNKNVSMRGNTQPV